MAHEPETSLPITSMRAQIDALDHALVNLLAERRVLVSELFAWKTRHLMPLVDHEREEALLAERSHFAEARGVPAALVERVFRAILDASHDDASSPGNLAHEDGAG